MDFLSNESIFAATKRKAFGNPENPSLSVKIIQLHQTRIKCYPIVNRCRRATWIFSYALITPRKKEMKRKAGGWAGTKRKASRRGNCREFHFDTLNSTVALVEWKCANRFESISEWFTSSFILFSLCFRQQQPICFEASNFNSSAECARRSLRTKSIISQLWIFTWKCMSRREEISNKGHIHAATLKVGTSLTYYSNLSIVCIVNKFA